MVDINTIAEDVAAIEQELGVTPSGVYSTVRTRLDILESRINNPFAPSPDVENPFFIGNDGVSISTGIGAPTENRINGSLYLRQDGQDGYEIYSRQNNQWQLIASAAIGPQGPAGQGAFTTTTSSFVQPNINQAVTIDVVNTSWTSEGAVIFIQGAGYYSIDTVSSNTSLIVINLGYVGPSLYTFPTPGTTISSGASVTASAAQGIGSIVFAYTSSMSNFDTTSLPDGICVNIAPPRAMTCTLDKNSTITPDNLRYFAATPSGVWIRDIVTGLPGAAEVANWYASPSGDDNNDGLTDLTPVQNIEEIQYRIGKQLIDGNTVGFVFINLLGDYNDGREYSFDFNFIHSGAIVIFGQKNVQATYTISSVTQWNETTGVIGAYSLTGSPNLSSYVGSFARISASTNPASIGRKTLIVSTPSTGTFNGSFIDQVTLTTAEPIVGDTIQIYKPTKLGGNIIINSTPVVFNSGGGMYFQDVDLGVIGSNHSTTVGSGAVSFIACILRGCDVQPGVNVCLLSICGTYDLRSYGFLTMYGTIMQSAGGTLLDIRGGSCGNSYTRCWAYGGGIEVGHSADGTGTFSTSDTFVISSAGNIPGSDCVFVTSKSTLVIGNKFLLINDGTTANGFHVRPGGGVYYPTATLPAFFGTTPTTMFRIGTTTASSLSTGIKDTNSSAEMVPGDV